MNCKWGEQRLVQIALSSQAWVSGPISTNVIMSKGSWQVRLPVKVFSWAQGVRGRDWAALGRI